MTTRPWPRPEPITSANLDAALGIRVHLGLGFRPDGSTNGGQTVDVLKTA
jgi:hypothetical protein